MQTYFSVMYEFTTLDANVFVSVTMRWQACESWGDKNKCCFERTIMLVQEFIVKFVPRQSATRPSTMTEAVRPFTPSTHLREMGYMPKRMKWNRKTMWLNACTHVNLTVKAIAFYSDADEFIHGLPLYTSTTSIL